MAKSYVGVAPLTTCRTAAPVSYISVYAGSPVPENVDPEDLKRLVDEGFLAESNASKADSDDAGDSKPAKIEDILDEVGEDKEKAAAALEAENATDKPRSSLVKKLQAVIDAEGS